MTALAIDQVGAPPSMPDAQEGVQYVGAAAGDRLGTAVAGVGDLTGNGSHDVAFGAPFADRLGAADVGKTYLRGAVSAANLHLGTVNVGSRFPGVTFVGAQAGELSGSAVSGAGDVGADGLDDFLVGSPGGHLGPAGANSGRAFIVFDQPDDCGLEDESSDDDDD